MLCAVASVVNFLLGSFGAVFIGIIFTAFFVIIAIAIVILGFVIARTQRLDIT